MEQHKIQELCLREISHMEKYINSNVIGNPYPKYTDQTIYRKTGERIDIISDTNSYTEEINQKLPEMDSILHPVCSMEMSYHFSSLISCKGDDWKPFGYKRKIELLRIKGSVLFHQLRKLNLTHAWKEIYTNVNEFCDSHGIPYKNRKRMYLREIEMISLFIHDCLPHNYAEQGIWAGDTSLPLPAGPLLKPSAETLYERFALCCVRLRVSSSTSAFRKWMSSSKGPSKRPWVRDIDSAVSNCASGIIICFKLEHLEASSKPFPSL